MLAYVLFRVAAGIATLVVVSIITFLALQVIPGDVASSVLGRNAAPEAVARLRDALGLNDSLLQQYWRWASHLLQGDLGNSTVVMATVESPTHTPSAAGSAFAGTATDPALTTILADPLKNSAILALISAVLMVPLYLSLGLLSALFAGRRVDHIISTVTLAVIALPEFVFGSLLLVLFFGQLGMLPGTSLVPPGGSPLDDPAVLVLPVVTLLGVTVGAGIRLTRAGMLEVLGQEYVTMARLNGFRERVVLSRVVLRNGLASTVQITAQNLIYLFGGIIVVESIFAYPGIGTSLVQAIGAHDATATEAIAMMLASAYVVINILADFAVVLLVPKLRTAA
jgi:peptide/nickel transport system permease protein